MCNYLYGLYFFFFYPCVINLPGCGLNSIISIMLPRICQWNVFDTKSTVCEKFDAFNKIIDEYVITQYNMMILASNVSKSNAPGITYSNDSDIIVNASVIGIYSIDNIPSMQMTII